GHRPASPRRGERQPPGREPVPPRRGAGPRLRARALMRARWPFLAIVSLAAGAASAELGRPAPSPVIYPRQTIPLWFSPAQHLAGGAACEGCHVDAAASTPAADDPIPAGKVGRRAPPVAP